MAQNTLSADHYRKTVDRMADFLASRAAVSGGVTAEDLEIEGFSPAEILECKTDAIAAAEKRSNRQAA